MTLSEFEAHHCKPSTLAFQDFYLIPTTQLCGASLGPGVLGPGCQVCHLAPLVSAHERALSSQFLGNAHSPIPREDGGCWNRGTDLVRPLRLRSPSSQRGNPNHPTPGLHRRDRKNNPEPWNRLSPNDQYKVPPRGLWVAPPSAASWSQLGTSHPSRGEPGAQCDPLAPHSSLQFPLTTRS